MVWRCLAPTRVWLPWRFRKMKENSIWILNFCRVILKPPSPSTCISIKIQFCHHCYCWFAWKFLAVLMDFKILQFLLSLSISMEASNIICIFDWNLLKWTVLMIRRRIWKRKSFDLKVPSLYSHKQFLLFYCMESSTLLSWFFFISFFKNPYPSFGCRENREEIDRGRGRNFHDCVSYFLLVFWKWKFALN